MKKNKRILEKFLFEALTSDQINSLVKDYYDKNSYPTYKKLKRHILKKYHPDMNDDPDASENFQQANRLIKYLSTKNNLLDYTDDPENFGLDMYSIIRGKRVDKRLVDFVKNESEYHRLKNEEMTNQEEEDFRSEEEEDFRSEEEEDFRSEEEISDVESLLSVKNFFVFIQKYMNIVENSKWHNYSNDANNKRVLLENAAIIRDEFRKSLTTKNWSWFANDFNPDTISSLGYPDIRDKAKSLIYVFGVSATLLSGGAYQLESALKAFKPFNFRIMQQERITDYQHWLNVYDILMTAYLHYPRAIGRFKDEAEIFRDNARTMKKNIDSYIRQLKAAHPAGKKRRRIYQKAVFDLLGEANPNAQIYRLTSQLGLTVDVREILKKLIKAALNNAMR